MSETKGIKETTELLEGLKEVAVAAKKVMADGKIGVSDFPVLLEEIKKVNVLTAAVTGLGEIPLEIKDLSGEEAQVIVAKVLELVAALKAA